MRKQNLVAGVWRDSDRVEAVIDPYRGETLAEVALATPAQLDLAIEAAHRATRVTGALPVWRRAEILRSVARGIAARHDELAATICAEAGKPIDYARGEATRAIETFEFAADELRASRGEVIPLDASPRADTRWGMTRRFPAGPVAAITPFNFPLNLVAHKLAPAIMAGCPVVLKPANKTPLSALILGEIVLEAGWPAWSGMGTSEARSPVIWMKRPRPASPLCNWPVECRNRGPYPRVVARPVRSLRIRRNSCSVASIDGAGSR